VAGLEVVLVAFVVLVVLVDDAPVFDEPARTPIVIPATARTATDDKTSTVLLRSAGEDTDLLAPG
jgi:hypothetical protein